MVIGASSNLEHDVLESRSMGSFAEHGFLNKIMFFAKVEGEGQFTASHLEGDSSKRRDDANA